MLAIIQTAIAGYMILQAIGFLVKLVQGHLN